jgi:hypothetical protein
MLRRILIILGFVILIVFGYHYYLSENAIKKANESINKRTESNAEVELSVNPVTDRVKVTLFPATMENVKDNPLAVLAYGLGRMFGETLGKAIAPFVEEELNKRAHEHYDIYAMLIPYRLHFSVEEPDAKTLSKLKDRLQNKRKKEEEARHRRADVYKKDGLLLEGIRVAQGQQVGRSVTTVSGTIVNRGQKTLREVRIRIYFLDGKGQRIGEKEYSPVLVSKLPIGDNTPLRPGYRKDFIYPIDESAPSGWAKQVEVEIVNIEFLEETS